MPNPAPRRVRPTQQQRDTFVGALRAGNYINVAVKLADIGESSYYAWKKEAETDSCRDWVREFIDAAEQAQAQFQARMVQTVRKAAEVDWKAALAVLERTRPNDWSPAHRHKAEIVHHVEPSNPHEELAAALAELSPPDGVIEAWATDATDDDESDDEDDEEPERAAS